MTNNGQVLEVPSIALDQFQQQFAPPPQLNACGTCFRPTQDGMTLWHGHDRLCMACALPMQEAGITQFRSPAEARVYEAAGQARTGLDSTWLSPQYRVQAGGIEWTCDFAAYVTHIRCAFEIDGRVGHTSHAAIDRDRRKDIAFRRAGWALYRWTGSEAFYNPEGVVEEMLEIAWEEYGRQVGKAA
jgi:very-short-patch-repair endonuclease